MCTDLKKNRYRKNYVLFLLCKWLVLVTFVFWSSINLALLNLEVSRTEGWMVALILLIIFSYWGFNLFKIEKDLGINTKKNNVILPPTNVHIEKTEDVSENIRRYKEAQQKVVDEIKLERSKASWFSSFWH
jgi:hypothetical protein